MKRTTPPPSPQLLELLATRRAALAPLALALRDVVLREAPAAHELVYSHYVVGIVFTLTGRGGDAFCHIAVYEKHVNLGFDRGATLDDKHGLLAGTGKRIRHIRIATEQDLQLPLRHYVRAALAEAPAAPAQPARRAKTASKARGAKGMARHS